MTTFYVQVCSLLWAQCKKWVVNWPMDWLQIRQGRFTINKSSTLDTWENFKTLQLCNFHLCFATNIEAKQNKRKHQEQEQGMGQVNGIETQLKRNDMKCGSPRGSTLKTLNLNFCFKNALSTCTITLKIGTPKQWCLMYHIQKCFCHLVCKCTWKHPMIA